MAKKTSIKTKNQGKKQPAGTAKISAKAKSAFGLEKQFESLTKWFQAQDKNDEPLFQVLDMFPIPIEIFAPDGTCVFLNRALMELHNLHDKNFAIGKYNVLKDPIILQIMEQMGLSDKFQKVFQGEAAICKDFPAPVADLQDRGLIDEKPYEKGTMDLYNYPIWKDDKLHFVVCVFVVRNLYMGRPDVARAKEYIDNHWLEEFDLKVMAKSANMSITPLYNLFKQHIGMTPGEYYKKVKVEHIKEKLTDKSLSIKEAFAACGEDSRGHLSKVFKEITGLTPTDYRKNLK